MNSLPPSSILLPLRSSSADKTRSDVAGMTSAFRFARGPLIVRGVIVLAAALVSRCGGENGPTGPSSTATPDTRTTISFSGRYDVESNTYFFPSAFTVTAEGPLDVEAQASEPTGSYQFALLRVSSPGNCSGVVLSTPISAGAKQSGHWNLVAPGTYCMNMARSRSDRSYSWTGTITHP